MGFRIVIAGESQCQAFAECCIVANFLAQSLPNFCYDQMEKPILDWQTWLCDLNLKNKWHHVGSPVIWKEMLMAGSKPYYIGGAPQFLDYCYSYYNFASLFGSDRYEDTVKNIAQYKDKIAEEKRLLREEEEKNLMWEKSIKTNYTITISGVKNLLAMHLVSGLLEMNWQEIAIGKLFVYDEKCSEEFLLALERECSYIETCYPGKVVKYVDRIGMALASTDLLIILDHVPFEEKMGIGEWLHANDEIIDNMALMINASGARSMNIVFANLGPACYNATRLRKLCTSVGNIVVATSDLGLEILPVVSEIALVNGRNIFCPPVWGFVGINHLVDIRTTIQRYDSFDPYARFLKVKKSSLKIGSLTPELRIMEYLMYYDETLWKKVADAKKKYPMGYPWISKAVVVLNLIKLWLCKPSPHEIVNLGIPCNGSFGLRFDGIFSQPARLIDGEWVPASDFLLPKDRNMSLKYLEDMAKWIMTLKNTDLPALVPFISCICKAKGYKNKSKFYLGFY